jgi:hypothetical protein
LNKLTNYFKDDSQDAFWKAMSPDIRVFLNELEKKEDWTYEVNEFEKFFSDISSALPAIVQLPLEAEHQKVIQQLIPILFSMPLRQCMSAIAYLDRYGSTEENPIGWGVVCFLEASTIVKYDTKNEIYGICKLLCQRVRVFIHSSLSTELFLNINKEVVKNAE